MNASGWGGLYHMLVPRYMGGGKEFLGFCHEKDRDSKDEEFPNIGR